MNAETTDIELAQRWREERDAQAFAGIVHRYADMVYGTCRRIVGDSQEAEDITQECFATFAESNVRVKTSLGGWLHRTASRRAIDHVRSGSSRRVRERRFVEERQVRGDEHHDDIHAFVDEAIDALPHRLRDPLVSHFLRAEPQREIAARLGISASAVSQRIERGVTLIRKNLKRQGISVVSGTLTSFFVVESAIAAPATVVGALGKTAISGISSGALWAAGGTQALTVGGLVLMSKQTVGVVAIVVLLIGGAAFYSVPVEEPPAQNGESETESAMLTPESAEELLIEPLPLEAVSETVETEPEPVEVELALEPESSPVDGLWAIESYTMTDSKIGEVHEVFSLEEDPAMRIDSDGTEISLTVPFPWNAIQVRGHLAYWGELDGTSFVARSKIGSAVELRGTFTANWTRFEGKGTHVFDTEPEASLPEVIKSNVSRMHYELKLTRIEDWASAPVISNDELQKLATEDARVLGQALFVYAKDHGGSLPHQLGELIPDYVSGELFLRGGAFRDMKYTGGSVPKGLLDEGTPWDDFKPSLPMPERIEAWEAYQQERWGSDQPILSPALSINIPDIELEIFVDGLGRIIQREYWMGTEQGRNSDELSQYSANNLKQLGLCWKMFENEHDGYSPAGLTSLYPDFLTDPSILTDLRDPIGTKSYVQVATVTNWSDFDDPAQIAKRPVFLRVRLEGSPGTNIHVIFMDGHVERMTEREYAEDYPDWPVEPHL